MTKRNSTDGLWTDGISHVVGRDQIIAENEKEYQRIYSTALVDSRAFPRTIPEETKKSLVGKNIAIVHAKDAEKFYESFQDWIHTRIRANEFAGLYYIRGKKSRTGRKYADEIMVGFTEDADYKRFENDILMPAKLAG